jgi:PGF-CTERM protein
MNRSLSVVVAALMVGWLFAVAAPAGAATNQSQVTLEIQVVDQADNPVGGVDVEATWDGGSTSATTVSSGRALIDVPEGADVEIDVQHSEYIRNRPVVVEDATEREVRIRVSLRGRLSVVATDQEGDPLSEVNVEFRKNNVPVAEGETDENGRYRTPDIEQGDYTIRVVKPGYFRESATARVGVDEQQRFELERGSARLDITVVDDHFEESQTLEGARVRLTDAEGEVATVRASGGTASLSVDINNRYRLTVLKDGYQETTTRVTVRESDRSVQAATQRVPTLTVEPQNRRVVVGESTRLRVLNAYDEPVEGADIRYQGESAGQTNANGEATVTIESTGEQQFRAVRDGVESEPIVIEGIEPGDDETPTDTGTETQSTPPTETGADGPGFGAAVAVLALLATALIARRIR